MSKTRGFFVTFEGIDGSGKSTQARRLHARLKREGYDVLFIREPGGTPVSERIRRLLLDPGLTIEPLTELLLYEASRAQLTAQVILPALESGTVIICDRFFDSTTAYQAFGRGLDRKIVERLNSLASFSTSPNITFIVDIDYTESLRRRQKKADRLENESKAFFNRVRHGFLKLARSRRVVVLDGHKTIAELADEVYGRITSSLPRRRAHA